MTPITFRVADITDAPEIVRLINAAFRPAPGTGGWTSEANLVSGERINHAMVISQINQPSSVFLLALHGTRLVACGHVDGRNPQAYIGTLAVEPSLQGEGIGTALIDYAEEYAAKVLGARSLVILVLAPNKELVAFYQRRHFQPTGRVFPYPNTGLGNVLKDNLMMLEMTKRADYWPKQKLNILFSPKEDWMENIKRGFEQSQHTITFADLSTVDPGQYDLVVPLTIPDLKYLDKVRHLVAQNPIPIPSLEAIELCDDKYLFNQALAKNGFAKFIPKMRLPLPYPYILKKRIDEWGVNSHIIHNAEDEIQFADQLASDDYFRQIFIPGANQYATHLIFKDQKIVCSKSIKYTYSVNDPIQGKDKISLRQVYESPHLPLFAAILSSIGFEGLCSIDYKVLENRPFILEINPRFGASLGSFFNEFADRLA